MNLNMKNFECLSIYSHELVLATTSALAIFDFTYLAYLLYRSSFIHPTMSTNRVSTRPKNATQRPGLLVPKQTRRSSAEVAASLKAKEDAKKEKEENKNAGIERVAEFEQIQAEKNAMEQTPRVVTKPKPLVRTRSYADVLRSSYADVLHSSDVEMANGTEPGSPFELAAVEAGQTTDDAMETEVQDLPQKKKVCFFLILFS